MNRNQLVKAEKEGGWIKWAGGQNPADEKHVEILMRSGHTNDDPAHYFRWDHDDQQDDIVKYRVIDDE